MITNIDNKTIEEFIKKVNSKEFILDRESKEITIDDVILVRTTDKFPEDGVIRSKALDGAYDEISNTFLEPFQDEMRELGVSRDISVKYPSGRSTIHFAINGLVSNHSIGNFSNRGFFIFEPLKNHLDSSILTIRPEDTYFKDEMKLSCNCMICMSNETFASLTEEEKETLSGFKTVYLYDSSVYEYDTGTTFGDDYNRYIIEDAIARYVLDSSGYPSFWMGAHGFQEARVKEKNMLKVLDDTRLQFDIDATKHFYSEVRREDEAKTVAAMEEAKKDFYVYAIQNADVSEEIKSKLLSIKDTIGMFIYKEKIKEMIHEVMISYGKEGFEQIILSYNESLKSKVLGSEKTKTISE